MELVTVKVKIINELENDVNDKNISFEIADLPDIILSDHKTEDLKKFFNAVFDFIIKNEKLLKFELENEGESLIDKVAQDIVKQMNNEIMQSKGNFEEFIEFKNK